VGPDGAGGEAAGGEVGDVAMVWGNAGALSQRPSVSRLREDATAQRPLEEHRLGAAVPNDAERTVAVGGEHGRLVGVVAAEQVERRPLSPPMLRTNSRLPATTASNRVNAARRGTFK